MNKKRILLLILVASLKLSNIQSNPIKNLFFKTQTRTFVTGYFLGGVINYLAFIEYNRIKNLFFKTQRGVINYLAFINYSSNINIFPYL